MTTMKRTTVTTIENEGSTKKSKLRNIISLSPESNAENADEGIAIDEDDYRVVRKLFPLDESVENILDRIEIEDRTNEHRLRSLIVPRSITSLPQSIGNLTGLTRLNLCESSITSLPSSIGKLENLKKLDLYDTMNLSSLPEEIGNLVSLTELNLRFSTITSLPPSIWRLQNLEELDLSSTTKLSSIPKEIGNLASLTELNLSGSRVASLPSSIGQLNNLQYLNLSWTKKLSSLPEEIGNLINVTRLYLNNSSVTSLPPSIGDMSSLKMLDLENSGITSLPDSIKSLANLIFLDLQYTPMAKSHDYLLVLAHHSNSLGFLGRDVGARNQDLCHALACNRARTRLKNGSSGESFVGAMPKLWPLVLSNASEAFRSEWYGGGMYYISRQTAIYQLLLDERESFAKFIVNRK